MCLFVRSEASSHWFKRINPILLRINTPKETMASYGIVLDSLILGGAFHVRRRDDRTLGLVRLRSNGTSSFKLRKLPLFNGTSRRGKAAEPNARQPQGMAASWIQYPEQNIKYRWIFCECARAHAHICICIKHISIYQSIYLSFYLPQGSIHAHFMAKHWLVNFPEASFAQKLASFAESIRWSPKGPKGRQNE